ncbi:MAG: hypothetical protein AAF787_02665 [Chloroflexota bacterium]
MAMDYPFEHPAVLLQAVNLPIDTTIDSNTLEQLGKALMVIAGADGKLSMYERGWLSAFMGAYGASQELIDRLDDYDYGADTLDALIPPMLAGTLAPWARRALVQGAIRMARADGLDEKEYDAIVAAAKAVSLDTALIREVENLLLIMDRAYQTYSNLLTAAQTEGDVNYAPKPNPTDTWEMAVADVPDDAPLSPEAALLTGEQFVLAKTVLWVMGADGSFSDEERGAFVGYMRRWGATDDQINDLMAFDYTAFNVQALTTQSENLPWGLSLLTRVALRFAGADGLNTEEEDAILSLYRVSGQNAMLYHATKGLEDMQRISLERLNVIFGVN